MLTKTLTLIQRAADHSGNQACKM